MRPVLPTLLLISSVSAFGQTGDPAFTAALAAHGGAALLGVQTVIITGQSSVSGTTQRVTISAALDGRLRVDYGMPVTRSIITTLNGRFEIRNGQTVPKPPHDGVYTQLDLLSVFGIRHLASGSERNALGAGSISGRLTQRVQAITGRQQIHYRRQVRDDAEVHFDSETGLVAAISRQQYAAESLDLAFRITNTFSDYRQAAGLVLPYRKR